MAFIAVPLYYDLDLLKFTTSAGGIAQQPNLVLGQSDNINFSVQFVNGGVGYDLGDPSFIFAIKAINDTAGDYLVQSTSGIKVGSGTSTTYSFEVVLDSTELRAWLLTVTAVTNYAAISIRDTTNEIVTLPALTCTILPDYTLEGTTPTDASGTLIVASGQTFTVNKSFAMPTTDGSLNYVLKTNGAGVGSWAADSTGTGTVTSVAQSFTGGIVSVSGSPVTTSGTLALTVAGTSGGIPYFSSGTAWATSGVMGAGALVVGGGAGATPTALAAVATGRVLTSAGTTTTPAYSSTITLGASGTLGTITLGNATSGTILITPPTGALGTVTLTLPITTTTLAGLAVTQTFTAINTFSSSTASSSTTTGAVLISAGGLGVSGSVYLGGVMDIPATTSTAGQVTQAGTRLLHTYGTANIFLGAGAGNFTTTGLGKNIAIGRIVMQSLQGGVGNIAIGDACGYSITSGSSNMLFGEFSGNLITTGTQNVALGVSSLRGVTTTSENTAIGFQALYSTTGSKNTGVGVNSSWTCTSGSKNTFIGEYSGASTDTIGGLTGVGFTTGSNNTMLGQNTASTSATGNYRTAVGSDARCNVNNAIKLGRDHTSTVVGDMVMLPSVLTANLPTATAAMAGAIIYVSDDGTGHINFCNGTSWARVN